MDIAALSVAVSQSNLESQVGMAVMNLAKEQVEQNGQNIIEDIKSMELSVSPYLGSQMDIRV